MIIRSHLIPESVGRATPFLEVGTYISHHRTKQQIPNPASFIMIFTSLKCSRFIPIKIFFSK